MHFENVLKRILILLWISTTYYNGITADDQLGNPYRILGVDRKATLHDIRQAYRNLVKKWYVSEFRIRCELWCDVFKAIVN